MVAFLALAFVIAQADSAGSPLHYTLRAVRTVDRTDLYITARLPAAGNAIVRMELPQDCYGTPDIHRFVRDFTVVHGSGMPDSSGRVYTLTADAAGEILLRYVLSYDPAILDNSAFAPNVGPQHFHVGGCQWMLKPEDTRLRRRQVIDVDTAGLTWHLYSSLSASAAHLDTLATYSELVGWALGGNQRPPTELRIEGKPLKVFVEGNYVVPRDSLAALIGVIVRREREWFRDHTQEFYAVTVLPRSNRLAGTALPNLFVCFIGSDRTLEEVLTLIAHETTHNWLPNKAEMALPPGETRLRFQWLNEGVPDYIARTLLRDAGLISEERFVELVNADLANLAANPYVTATHAALGEVARSGQTGGPFTRLPYNRGALLALNWDRSLRAAGRPDGLRALMADVLAVARLSKGRLPEDSLFAAGERHGVPIRADFERHVLKGEAIAAPADALGARYELVTVPMPSPFDAGFTVERSARVGTVFGVTAGGPADAAGLRDGMSIVQMENWNRFSPTWRPDAPMQVTVRDQGATRVMSIVPRGNPIRVAVYQLKRGNAPE